MNTRGPGKTTPTWLFGPVCCFGALDKSNFRASQVVLVVKNLPANAGDIREFAPWVRKIPWRRAWLPTPVFLPGESHGQRSLAGYA